LHEIEIASRVDAQELVVARVAGRQRLRQKTRGAQPRGDRFDTFGALRVRDAAQVIAVERVSNELQKGVSLSASPAYGTDRSLL
jgi:hypothetical protein